MLDKLTKPIIDFVCSVGNVIVLSIDKYSFKICLLVGLGALIFAIFGYDKGKKIATISPAVYVIIQIFLKGWFGV